jgi:hypothetical protein
LQAAGTDNEEVEVGRGHAAFLSGQALLQRFGHQRVHAAFVPGRALVQTFDELGRQLASEGHQARRGIKAALLALVGHTCGPLAKAARHASAFHLAFKPRGEVSDEIGFFHAHGAGLQAKTKRRLSRVRQPGA